jgi:hypothetical protein
MPRRLSMNARMSLDAPASDELQVYLLKITHPYLDAPVRLSTDPTECLSYEPLMYGTKSTWQTSDGSPFLFVLVSAQLPSDKEDEPAGAALVLENVDNQVAQMLRSTTARATVDMAVVLASSPNLIEQEFLGLRLMSVEGNASEVTLNISRDPINAEPWPAGRMTRQRFPGLHR